MSFPALGMLYKAKGAGHILGKNMRTKYGVRLYSAQPPLTLDDVLPSSTPPSPTSQQRTPPMESSNRPYDSNLSPSSDRFSNRSGFSFNSSRRSAIELAADPLRRRSGEPTHYSLIVHSTSNNTRLTLTHTPVSYLPGSSPGHAGFQAAYPMAGSVVTRVTAGTVGFKRGRRQEYEAATQATLAMFNKIRELIRQPTLARVNSTPSKREGIPRELEIVFNGFGVGRDAFMSSLLNSQATDLRELVRSIRDATTLKIGGPRPKKRRRV